jgi:hypothetical protein
VHDGIAASHHLRVARNEVNLVTLRGDLLKDLAWVAVLKIDGAAGVPFVEAGSVHSGLDIHVEVNHVGNKLRVGLGLVEAGPHYRDLAQMWRNGQYFPLLFSRTAVENATGKKINLIPSSH